MNEVLEKEDEGHSSDDDDSDESSEYEDYSGNSYVLIVIYTYFNRWIIIKFAVK